MSHGFERSHLAGPQAVAHRAGAEFGIAEQHVLAPVVEAEDPELAVRAAGRHGSQYGNRVVLVLMHVGVGEVVDRRALSDLAGGR